MVFVLKAALNGNRPPASHPALPLTPSDLATDAAVCVRAGVAAIHIHPRRDAGAETLDPEIVDETVKIVRAAARVPIGVSTGAWIEVDPTRRADLVSRWLEPDMASVNFGEEGAELVVEALFGAGIGVEAGVWSIDDAERLAAAHLTGRLVRVLVEVVHPTPNPVGEVMAINGALDRLGIDVPRLFHGEGEAAWPVVRFAFAQGFDTRIGLEDTLYLPDGTLAASNIALVEAAMGLTKR